MPKVSSATTRIALFTVVLVAGSLGAASAVAAGAETPDLTGKSYVALGDSYSAGFGILPYSDQPASGCFQADANYPHLVAAELGLVLDDRTCSGAVTANIIDTPQVTITGAGTAPVQSDALTPETDLVTVTIGGNDLGFADIAKSCIAESPTGPLIWDIDGIGYETCHAAYVRTVDGFTIDLLADRIAQVVTPRLEATFALIAQKAPNAEVVVIGYPAVAPNAEDVPVGGCWTDPLGPSGLFPPFPQNSFPFTDIDTLYLHVTEAKLDAAIGAAAQAHGATYVSTIAATSAHSACARGAAGSSDEPYVNGITITNDGTPANSTPIVDGYGAVLGALHPNAAGVAFLQGQVVAAIRGAFAADPGPTPTVDPGAVGAGTGAAGLGEADSAEADGQLAASGLDFPVLAVAGGAALLLIAGAILLIVRQRGRRRD